MNDLDWELEAIGWYTAGVGCTGVHPTGVCLLCVRMFADK